MKTFPYYSEEDRLTAFEVRNILCSRRRATRIAGSVDGARILRKPQKRFALLSEEVFCELELDGYLIEISEPYGDNSRYLISSSQAGSEIALEKIRNVFGNA